LEWSVILQWFRFQNEDQVIDDCCFMNAVIWYVYCLISGADFDSPKLTVCILTVKSERDLNLHVGYQNAEHSRRAIHGGTGDWDNGLEWTMICMQDKRRLFTFIKYISLTMTANKFINVHSWRYIVYFFNYINTVTIFPLRLYNTRSVLVYNGRTACQAWHLCTDI